MNIRVDLIHGGWLNAPNGASAVLKSFYTNKKMFLQYGIDMSFYTLDRPGDKFAATETVNRSTFRSKIRNAFTKLSRGNAFIGLISVYLLYVRHGNLIIKTYKKSKQKAGIVFLHDVFTAYSYLKYCKGNNQIMVLVLHNNGETWNMLKIAFPAIFRSYFASIIFDKIEKKVLNRADKIGFVSEASRNVFVKNHCEFEEKAFFIYNGIENTALKDDHIQSQFSDFEYRLCCVGTLSERKGQARLVQAFANLPVEKRNKIHITLVGDGDLRELIENIIKQYNLQNNVSMLGRRNDVDKILSQNNIFILPSNDEGLPIAIIEAMRAGMPIISTPIAGIPELVINGYNGVLVNYDVDSISSVLSSLSNLNMEVMGINSRRLFEAKFAINAMIHNYSSLFKKL